MIADQLAVELSKEYVMPGHRVLDPFCGTGRTLVTAADRGATAIGVDVNPLAVLMSITKGAPVRTSAFEKLREAIRTRSAPGISEDLELEPGRQVKWFSSKAKRELSSLVGLLNEASLSQAELRLAACILSATARDVSFCRKDQWKIHRMPAQERSAFRRSAWKIFASRLDYVLKEVKRSPRLSGTVRAFLGDSTKLEGVTGCNNMAGFDLVFTSPPYGDSRTTVQYGGISSLCLGVLRFLSGLVIPAMPARSIDTCCLGGALNGQQSIMNAAGLRVSSFWIGEPDTTAARRVTAFLADLLLACEGSTRRLKRNGHAIFVVGRRTVAGAELRLDEFLIDVLELMGCVLVKCDQREISGKMTPYVIHRRGAATNPKGSVADFVGTMRREHVLVFRKAKELDHFEHSKMRFGSALTSGLGAVMTAPSGSPSAPRK